jgi:hypothetical protein
MKRIFITLLLILLSVNTAQAVSINFSGRITSDSLEWWGIENGSSFNGQISYTPVTGSPSDADTTYGNATYYSDTVSWTIYAGGYYLDFEEGTLNSVSFFDNKTPYGAASTGDSISIEKYALHPNTDCPIYSNIEAAGGHLDDPSPSWLWFNGSDQSLSFFDSFPDPIDFSSFTNGEFHTGLDHAGSIQSSTFCNLSGTIESVSVPEPNSAGLLIGFLLPMFFFTAYYYRR